MKATDLMIGDWVKCTDPRCEGHQVDLIDLCTEEVGLDGETDNFENIIPIPLTPEILEKNGFIRVSSSGKLCGWYLEKDLVAEYYVIDVTYNNDRLYIEIHGSATIEKCCDYVHELQHALRLCGIEKEVVL